MTRGRRTEAAATGDARAVTAAGPYAPLVRFLAARRGDEVALSFAEVERIVGFALSLPLRTDTDRWRNATRLPAKAWRAIGWHARLEYPARRVIFRRSGIPGAPDRR